MADRKTHSLVRSQTVRPGRRFFIESDDGLRESGFLNGFDTDLFVILEMAFE